MVQRRNISYAAQTQQGTKVWDIFMSLVDTREIQQLGKIWRHWKPGGAR